jgi:NosR/NirI family nitrous oxide reductase transcriptional regulator
MAVPEGRPKELAARAGDAHNAGPSDTASDAFDLIWDEARHHVLPWERRFVQRGRGAQAASIGFAFAVTVVWVLGILGHVRPLVVAGWWAAWTLFEVVVRVNCKRAILEGPLLRRIRRHASAPQVTFYVLTKNALVAGLLFLLMSALG